MGVTPEANPHRPKEAHMTRIATHQRLTRLALLVATAIPIAVTVGTGSKWG
jgi:hypothetical protein